MKNLEATLKKHKFACDERTMLFRIKQKNGGYERNIENLSKGRTDFWQISEKDLHPGQGQTIVLMVDHPDDATTVDVFAGVLEKHHGNGKGRKILWAKNCFEKIAQTPAIGINNFVGKAANAGVVYPFRRTTAVERDLTKKDGSDLEFLKAAQTVTMRRKHNEMTESLRMLLPDVKQGMGKESMYDALIKNYDGAHRDLLVEVKSSTELAHVRMAVGQLFSYWHAKCPSKEQDLAVLLPAKPKPNIIGFLQWMNIGLLWLSDGKLYTMDAWLEPIAKRVA